MIATDPAASQAGGPTQQGDDTMTPTDRLTAAIAAAGAARKALSDAEAALLDAWIDALPDGRTPQSDGGTYSLLTAWASWPTAEMTTTLADRLLGEFDELMVVWAAVGGDDGRPFVLFGLRDRSGAVDRHRRLVARIDELGGENG